MGGNPELFEGMLVFDAMAALAAFVAWMLAGCLSGSLAFIETRGRMRLVAGISLFTIVFAVVATAVKLAMFWRLSTYGQPFVADKMLVVPPMLALAALAVLVFSVPRMWRLVRSKSGDARGVADASVRRAASEPLLVVPVGSAALAAAISVYLTFFPPGVPSRSLDAALWTAMLAGTAILWLRQRRRHRKTGEAPARPKVGMRLLRAGAVATALSVGFAGLLMYSSQSSELPESFSMMSHENVDFGGGSEVGHGESESESHGGMEAAHAHEGHDHHADGGDTGDTVAVTELGGPKDEEPDERFALTAEKSEVELSSGETIEAWTFDGKTPGPELRVERGDLVEIKLTNKDIEDGATLHWHGVDVPNAEDGVAGLTQNAVMPGESHTYRFVAEDAGTYWYHSHQVSSEQVKKGLFGSFVVEPKNREEAREFTLMSHSWGDPGDSPGRGPGGGMTATLNGDDTLRREAVEPGTPVRFRLVNTDSHPVVFSMRGTPFEVAAIDGADLNEPDELTDTRMELAAGGRYDITFTMPENPVRLGVVGDIGFTEENPDLGLLVSPDGEGELPVIEDGPMFDPSDYGDPEEMPFGASSDFDREFEVIMDNQFGFYDRAFNMLWTINGEVFPNTPMHMVREGDLVKTTFVNRSFMDHPMHLHGHHVLVLSRNGEPVSGSPWWADTLNVAPGETYEVAFRADNPGIWMDHCHNLDHAALGMTMHLGYEGVSTPFMAGEATGNVPE